MTEVSMQTTTAGARAAIVSVALTGMIAALPAAAERLDDSCKVALLNRTANVQPDGSWTIFNVPAGLGLVRVRATCVRPDGTVHGQSSFIEIDPGIVNGYGPFEVGAIDDVPRSVALSAPATVLEALGDTVPVSATATLPDESTRDVTPAEAGTSYQVTNPEVATVGGDGLVTALASGRVIVQATHEGLLATLGMTVLLAGDSDGDGLPDDYELGHGLDPNDLADALEDPDRDGLTNLQEFDLGTDPRNPDSDGDGLADGEEAVPGDDGFETSPVLVDSDGDGVWDGLEVEVGTDPTDPLSVDYGLVVEDIVIEPGSFVLVVNTILPEEVSRRVKVVGRMVDGNGIDLTAGRGTSYESSDLTVANFAAQDGRVFAGADGFATVTARNGGLAATTEVEVVSFAPAALGSVDIPGFANDVDVGGSYAFVAAGPTGLQVVDVGDRRNPVIVGSLDTAGNAFDVKLDGGVLYLADGSAGLQVIDVTVPEAPALLGSVDTDGEAWAVAFSGSTVYVADGSRGLAVIDVTEPAAPVLLGAVDTAGFAQGIDVSQGFAVIAGGDAGVQVVDVADPEAPAVVGTTHTRNNGRSGAADVVVRDRLAYVADGAVGLGGLRVVDFRNPTTPVVVGTTNDRFGLLGVALDSDLALAADIFFVNSVPIIDVGEARPIPRGTVDFTPDDNGTGVEARAGIVYLTAVRGGLGGRNFRTSGRLHIGAYVRREDTAGEPPTVRITTPLAGSSADERSTVLVEAAAEDDIRVDSVEFQVDGVAVSTDTRAPYRASIRVPERPTVRLAAIARDLFGNQASDEVELTVVLDDDPTVAITAPSAEVDVTGGSRITVSADATDDDRVVEVRFAVDGVPQATVTAPPYRFDYDVPLAATELAIRAVALDNASPPQEAADELVVPSLPDDPPEVVLLQPADGEEVVEDSVITVLAGASDDVAVDAVELWVDGVRRAEVTVPPYQTDVVVPLAASDMRAFAIARDSQGQTATSAEIVLPVIADPGTTVEGTVLLPDETAAGGADVAVFEFAGIADSDGRFSLPGVPTARGLVSAEASLDLGRDSFAGVSDLAVPVRGGVTELGSFALQLLPKPVLVALLHGRTSQLDLKSLAEAAATDIGSTATDVAITPDGAVAVVSNYLESTLTFLDLTAEPPSTLGVLPLCPTVQAAAGLAMTSDGRFVLTTDGPSGDNIVSVDVAGRTIRSEVTGLSGNQVVAITPDDAVVLTAGADPAELSVLTLDGDGVLADNLIRVGGPGGSAPVALAITPNGERALLSAAVTDHVAVFEVDGTAVTPLRVLSGLGSRLGGIAIAPDGGSAYVSSQDDGHVAVLDISPSGDVTDSGERIELSAGATPASLFGVDGLALTADGELLLVASADRQEVSVVDLVTMDVTVVTVDGDPLGLAVTPPQP